MDKLGTIYGKPIVGDSGFDADKVLRRIKASVLRRIRDKLIQSTFSERAKRALYSALTVVVGPSSLTIYSKHPAFVQLMRGQRRGQMRWLTKAKAPIPIITETGELIFRTATIKSMSDGKWIHPGRAPFDFVEKAKQEAKKQIRSAVVSEVRRMAKSIEIQSKSRR
jgi:hypothetical protein